MQEIYLDSHSWVCENANKIIMGQYFDGCTLNPQSCILFVNKKFFLIKYHSCIDGGDHIKFKKDLITQIIGKNKIYNDYEVNSGVDITWEIDNYIKEVAPLRKLVKQVNYVYYNNACKKYAITTDINFAEYIVEYDEMQNSYNVAVDYLKSIKAQCHLFKELDDIFKLNYIRNIRNINITKTIDGLVNLIKNQTK